MGGEAEQITVYGGPDFYHSQGTEGGGSVS